MSSMFLSLQRCTGLQMPFSWIGGAHPISNGHLNGQKAYRRSTGHLKKSLPFHISTVMRSFSADLLLWNHGKTGLAARRVKGVGNPQETARHVLVSGWRPVETRVHTSDISKLIKTLGGEQLMAMTLPRPCESYCKTQWMQFKQGGTSKAARLSGGQLSLS
jgi:hypothetical protein